MSRGQWLYLIAWVILGGTLGALGSIIINN